MENNMEVTLRSKNRATTLSRNLTLGIYLEKMKILTQKDTCAPVFIVAEFTVAKTWNQRKCPSTDEWIKKKQYSKGLQAMDAGEGAEKREPSYTVGGNAN